MSDFDALTEKATQLSALLLNTYGESGDPFRNTRDDIQDAYMWACSDMAREIKRLVDKLACTPRPL